jgi:tetratricopeptide (TPR) repeat protein
MHPMRRLLPIVFGLMAMPVRGQSVANPGNHSLCTLRVDVIFADPGGPAAGARLQLQQVHNATPAEVQIANSSGSADFRGLPAGDYRIEISGDGIRTTTSDVIHIDDGRVFESQTISVRRAEGASALVKGGGNTVTVAELNVPKEASQELQRGDEEMQHGKWKKAAEHFNKAVSIYPQYVSAYYNLSLAYEHLSRSNEQRDALQSALKINDHFVPALVGLAHLDVTDHKPDEARTLLDKAVTADGSNVEALALRVRVDFLLGQDQEAIADAKKVHDLPHQGYASVHYTAAAAYQRLNRKPETLVELKMFLQEDPNNPRTEYVRQMIAELQREAH